MFCKAVGTIQSKRGNRGPPRNTTTTSITNEGCLEQARLVSCGIPLHVELPAVNYEEVFEIAGGLDSFEQAPLLVHTRGLDLRPWQGSGARCT
jgi:hypothetical protein